MPKSPVLSFRVISSILNWTVKSQVNTHILMNHLNTNTSHMHSCTQVKRMHSIFLRNWKKRGGTEQLPRYASSWSLVKLAGKTVGIPGMKVFSFSSPPQRERLFFFFSAPRELLSESLLSSRPRFQLEAAAEAAAAAAAAATAAEVAEADGG